jgi:hypothetical protein
MTKILPFIDDLHIVDKAGEDVKLGEVLAWPQKDLLTRVEADLAAEKRVRYIILKARQIGISTAIEALMFTFAIAKPNFRGLVIAHENNSSQHLLSMTRYYYESFWGKAAYPTQHYAMNQLAFKHINTHIKVATAKNERAGRSQTLQFLHASEVAFWDSPEELMTGLEQSVSRKPRTMIFLESTANGIGGFFYNTWQRAIAGETSYVPLFYPWWAHPEYTAEQIGATWQTEGEFVAMDDEEKALMAFLSKPRKVVQGEYAAMTRTQIISRLIWRREILGTECQGDLNRFHQEYPSTPDEAFIATGTNAFDLPRLRKVYEPFTGHRGRLVDEGDKVRFIRDESGPLEIFRYPSNDREFAYYAIGADGKKAVQSVTGSYGDYACAQVVNRKTWEQVARWRGRLDQNAFGEELIKLGRFYNDALVAPETGIGGPGIAAHLVARNYPNIYRHKMSGRVPGFTDNQYGWITNTRTKTEAIGNLQSALFDQSIMLHDAITYEEMKNYVALPTGFGNADGKQGFDDTVMAMAIAITITKQEAMLMNNDARYQTPRYYTDGYKSTLSPSEAVRFDELSADLGVPESSVIVNGKERVGAGQRADWFQDRAGDWFGEGDGEA